MIARSLIGQECIIIEKSWETDQNFCISDSVTLENMWENSDVIAFSFSLIDENETPQSFTSYIKTLNAMIPMDPGCEVNLSEFDYVSKLVFLEKKDWEKITIVVCNENLSPIRLKVKLNFFNPHLKVPKLNPIVGERNEECVCPHPPYIPRSDWGENFNLINDIYIPPATLTEVTHLIVHHSATSNTSNNWPSVVAAIFNYHVFTNQWQDIGYNWLIDPEGNLYQGRGGGEDVRGAHMCGYNNNTMGICILGTFTNIDPSPHAMVMLKNLLSYKSCQKNFDPQGTADIQSYPGNMFRISGHKDGCDPNYTECPGNRLYAFLPSFREDCVDFIADSCALVNTGEIIGDKNSAIEMYQNFDRITVKAQATFDLYIYNIAGQFLQGFTIDAGENEVPLFLTKGLYILVFINAHQKIIKKIVKV